MNNYLNYFPLQTKHINQANYISFCLKFIRESEFTRIFGKYFHFEILSFDFREVVKAWKKEELDLLSHSGFDITRHSDHETPSTRFYSVKIF